MTERPPRATSFVILRIGRTLVARPDSKTMKRCNPQLCSA
jgi:hypothetical protein